MGEPVPLLDKDREAVGKFYPDDLRMEFDEGITSEMTVGVDFVVEAAEEDGDTVVVTEAKLVGFSVTKQENS